MGLHLALRVKSTVNPHQHTDDEQRDDNIQQGGDSFGPRTRGIKENVLITHRVTASFSDNHVVMRPTGMTMRLNPIAMIKNIATIRLGLNSIMVRITPEASKTDPAAATVVFLISAMREIGRASRWKGCASRVYAGPGGEL